MAVDKKNTVLLKKYAQVFKEAKERDANESDTVMLLTEFFKEGLDYDPLKGEISKEVAIKDRFCDVALKIEGEIELLVEVKSAGHKILTGKHIEQAENYASRSGLSWVLLTNGLIWQLYHVSFVEGEGISSDLAFEVSFDASNLDLFWEKVSMLSKKAIRDDYLEEFWGQKKALKPSVIVKALFSNEVLVALRRELNRLADARLDMEDVFDSIKEVVSKDALMEAGDISMTKKKKKRRKVKVAVQDNVVDTTVAVPVATESGKKDAA